MGKYIIELDDDIVKGIRGENDCEVEPREIVRSFQATIADAIKNVTPYNPSGDCISREALKEQVKNEVCEVCFDSPDERQCSPNCKLCTFKQLIDNAQTIPLPNEQIAWEQGYEAGLAQGKHNKPQVKVFAENADEKAVSNLKAELQNVIEARPKGEWITDEKGYFYCGKCGKYPHDQYATTNFCPNCGADMRGGAE